MALFPDNPYEHDCDPQEPEVVPCASGMSSGCDNEAYRQVNGEWFCEPCFVQWESQQEATDDELYNGPGMEGGIRYRPDDGYDIKYGWRGGC